jgi:shikimate dehydrogenase
MRQFGLIGYPLGHSFSKGFFAEKFAREKITDANYESYPLPSIADFKALVEDVPNLMGLNVTIPYKEQVIPFLHRKNEVVEKIGACNCIAIRNGELCGFNTDVVGFQRSLTESFSSIPSGALILGTGGAAKAVEYVLDKLNIHYKYVSRNPGEGQLSYNSLNPEIMNQYKLVINTSPLGMYPHTEEAPPIPYELMGSGHCLFDLVYNPPLTMFLKKGLEQGALVKNGYDMLIYQAEESWRIWNE